ncbi:hypothetical protein KKB83_05550 [Patescibacteria group bacterium]|nr:hypothetical protein [Patescibacteria group bacterium]
MSTGPGKPPGPYRTGDDGQQGGSGANRGSGRTHYTDHSDGHHTSWDEGADGVSGVHTTDHGTGRKTTHDVDSRGNPR